MEGGVSMTEAVAFDLDDTLLRDDRSISDFTVQVMKNLALHGVTILPASGRASESMAHYIERLDCCDCYIACNGAEVRRRDGSILMQVNLPLDIVLEIVQFGMEYGVYTQTYDGGSFFYNRHSHWAEEYAASTLLNGVYTPDLLPFVQLHPTCKILMMDAPDKISHMRAAAAERFGERVSITTSKPSFLEINPSGTSKGNALAFCADLLGFHLHKTIAFGDSLNDISMLTAAGTGVAVGNAWNEVKAVADAVCMSNEDDGVAQYLVHHFSNYF